jgi:hypothetical protein
MRRLALLLVLVVMLGLGSTVALQANKEKADTPRITDLITQLGSKKFTERRQASKALDAIGVPALEALRKATKSSDMEISRRAYDLVARIEKRIETDRLLTPTRVHLVCKDMPVADAVARLAKLSKYDIQLHPNSKAALAKRKVTLDTGKVTFWQAFDQLCEKASLVETTVHVGVQPAAYESFPVIQPPPPPPVKMIRPIRIRKGIKRIRINPPLPKKAFQIQKAAPPAKANVKQVQRAVQRVQIAVAAQAVQIQAQPVQVILPAAPADMPPMGFTPPANGQIFLADGKPQALATRYCGAVRLRLLTRGVQTPKTRTQVEVELEVATEPKLKNWFLLGSPKINEATDDRDQSLALVLEGNRARDIAMGGFVGGNVAALMPYVENPYAMPSYRQTAHVHLKLGTRPAKQLKNLTGRVAAEVATPPEALLTVDKILKAAGKTVSGARGGSIKVLAVSKKDNGAYEIKFKLEKPPGVDGGLNPFNAWGGVGFGGMGGGPINIQIQINGNIGVVRGIGGGMWAAPNGGGNNTGLALVDGKGNHYVLAGTSGTFGQETIEMTLTFRAGKGNFGPPEKLVYTAPRRVNVDVPFTFKDVKLP